MKFFTSIFEFGVVGLGFTVLWVLIDLIAWAGHGQDISEKVLDAEIRMIGILGASSLAILILGFVGAFVAYCLEKRIEKKKC